MSLVRLGIAIQAHPSRVAGARALGHRLRAPIEWSRAAGDVWDTHRRARQATLGADWSLVVQDDAILADDFEERLGSLLAETPHSVLSLFYRHKPASRFRPMRQAAEAGLAAGGFAWLLLQWGIANVIRGDLLADMLAYCEAGDWPPDRDDSRIREWVHDRGLAVWYALPSLVDHDPDGTSLVYHQQPNAGRVAWQF